MGLLTTAGDLLFGGDGSGNFVAYNPSTGDPIWRAGLAANPSNAPITFMLDGRQFVVVGAGDSCTPSRWPADALGETSA